MTEGLNLAFRDGPLRGLMISAAVANLCLTAIGVFASIGFIPGIWRTADDAGQNRHLPDPTTTEPPTPGDEPQDS